MRTSRWIRSSSVGAARSGEYPECPPRFAGDVRGVGARRGLRDGAPGAPGSTIYPTGRVTLAMGSLPCMAQLPVAAAAL